MQNLAGKFLVFDGPDGCGKTTQRDLLADHLQQLGLSVVKCKDPGGTEIGDRIRHVLLDYDLARMDVRCEALLFMASRAQLVGQVIEPALRAGQVVLCDRFVSATCAYQGAAGYDMQRVLNLAPYAIGDSWPDLTFVLDVDVETGFQRTGRKAHQAGRNRRKDSGQHNIFADAVTDAMEARPLEFHRQVRERFLQLPALYPRPVEIIPVASDVQQVHIQIMQRLQYAIGV
ncbi:MAG: Thymidylate kinase [Phycisphaerae bacterium]|nr:Thymidylate kinase [Phycisphaerae bacterium]